MEDLNWLMSWYALNCDKDWEHTYGVNINTIDNPGWSLKVDLTDTADEGKVFSAKSFINDNDWYVINCDGNKFIASGDSSKLETLINSFRKTIEKD